MHARASQSHMLLDTCMACDSCGEGMIQEAGETQTKIQAVIYQYVMRCDRYLSERAGITCRAVTAVVDGIPHKHVGSIQGP